MDEVELIDIIYLTSPKLLTICLPRGYWMKHNFREAPKNVMSLKVRKKTWQLSEGCLVNKLVCRMAATLIKGIESTDQKTRAALWLCGNEVWEGIGILSRKACNVAVECGYGVCLKPTYLQEKEEKNHKTTKMEMKPAQWFLVNMIS